MGSWEPGIEDFEHKYQWVTNGENCPLCEAMRGRVYILDVFVSTGFYPGFHPHCDCALKRVSDDTPESDRDIFGSNINTYLGIYGSLISKTWKPYNLLILDEFMRATPRGGTISDALAAFKAVSISDGSLLPSLFPSLNFKGLSDGTDEDAQPHLPTVRLYKSINGDYTSEWGLHPSPSSIRPITPEQSYHYGAR